MNFGRFYLALQIDQSSAFLLYNKKMKGKVEPDDLQREVTLDIDGISGSRHWAGGQYGEKKSRKKRNLLSNRLNTDQGKSSTYSSYSKLTSLIKGQSLAEADNFKISDSAYFNQLAQKYAPRGSPPQKIREQMQLALDRKKSEIQALRVHRDELKFISYNNPYDMPIKMSLGVLKQKARTQQKIKDMMMALQKDIKEIEFQFNTMTDYYNFVTNALKSNGDEDLIIDTQEEEKLMVQNLQKQTNHLFKELKEQDKKNAKQIKNLQDEIAFFRVQIKEKEDKIRDLKSMICTLHIKLHSRGSTSKEKSMSMSIRKFITQQNKSIQEAFIGNNSFKHYSKELLQKINANQQLQKIVFYYEPKKEKIFFKCVYKHSQGKFHSPDEEAGQNNTQNSPVKTKKEIVIQIGTQIKQIKLKYLLSMKFFFKSKIVGIQCRAKSQKGTEHIQIGNCSSNLQHQLLTLINKNIVTLGSYWHQRDMIGVGVWYCNKTGSVSRNTSTDSRSSTNRLKRVKSPLNVNAQTGEVLNEQYYNK